MNYIAKVIVAFLVYCLMVALLSAKSIYSLDEQSKYTKLLYFSIHTGGYLYLVHHFYTDKANKLLVALSMSILIGFIPYDSEYGRIAELLNNPTQNLSGISSGLPVYLGTIVDLFFYPTVLFISFLFLFFITNKRENRSEPN